MARPDRSRERRAELVPVIAATFAELGYRRTTTAALARRCGVQETILYRLWPDKKAMFLASIRHVFETSSAIWRRIGDEPGAGTPAERVLAHEAGHHGEFGLYRILFAGLGETDDPEIEARLRDTYVRFHRRIRREIEVHRGRKRDTHLPDPDLAAWALVGLGTVANVGRELKLFPARRRTRLLSAIGRFLLDGEGG